MSKFYLCNVQLSKYYRQRRTVKSAITALDVKINDWIDNFENNSRFNGSRRCLAEISEIVGELKFMYLSNIISTHEYKSILNHIFGEEADDEY